MHKIDNITITQKHIGEIVTYMPPHAQNNPNHPDAEKGVISSLNNTFIFVRFDGPNGQACKPHQLTFK